MGLSTKAAFSRSAGFEREPEGIHIAAFVGYCNLGLQELTWKGKPKQAQMIQVFLAFKAGDEFYTYSTRYSFSFAPNSNLRNKFVAHLLGKRKFDEKDVPDMDVLLGKCLAIQLGHTAEDDEGRVYVDLIGSMATQGKPNLRGYEFPVRMRDYYIAKYKNCTLHPSMKVGARDDGVEDRDLPF